MMRNVIFGMIVLLVATASWADTDVDFIKKNAVDIEQSHFPAGLTEALEEFQVLLVGELHGSSEYPAFVLDLVSNLGGPGKKLAVGLEIPQNEQSIVNEAVKKHDPFVLLGSEFFKWAYQDGRESLAMAYLIVALGQIDGVDVFCFDKANQVTAADRDLAMANNVLRFVNDHTPSQTILLTGNLHSRVTKGNPFDAKFVPMGYYLSHVKDHPIDETRILSILGRAGSGSFWACFGSVAEECGIKQVSALSGHYVEAKPAWRYFLFEPAIQEGHKATVYLKSVSASLPFKSEGSERQKCSYSTAGLDLMMAQDFWTFDQSPFGHRSLFVPPTYCSQESGQLIDKYLARHETTLTPSDKRILHFHAGQNYAFAKATSLAIERFRNTLNPDEPANPEFHWNAYVAATLAFLKKDNSALLDARKRFPAQLAGGDIINARVVDRFVRCGASSYWDAYSHSGTCAGQ